jgi:hypothetical protein
VCVRARARVWGGGGWFGFPFGMCLQTSCFCLSVSQIKTVISFQLIKLQGTMMDEQIRSKNESFYVIFT